MFSPYLHESVVVSLFQGALQSAQLGERGGFLGAAGGA